MITALTVNPIAAAVVVETVAVSPDVTIWTLAIAARQGQNFSKRDVNLNAYSHHFGLFKRKGPFEVRDLLIRHVALEVVLVYKAP